MQRISTEYKAGRYIPDVLTTSASYFYPLLKDGMLGRYVSPETDAIPKNLRDPAGYWTSSFIAVLTIAYNTRLVSPQDVPKSYADLLNPRWNGRKIGIGEGNSLRWFMAHSAREGKDRAIAYMERLSKQDPFFKSGGSTLDIQLLGAGEFEIVHAATTHSVETAAELGAPVKWVKTREPLFTIPVVIGIMARPPHPNAAKLYIDFTLSEEGQRLLRPVFDIPARTGVETVPPGLLKGLDLYPLRPEAFERFDEYQRILRSIFSAGH
jgi:ABC-type Fe3+ transport system substrate-binding protein